MILSSFLLYLPYAFVTAITPGPNNIILLYAVSRNGWQKGKTTFAGVFCGFWFVMVLCAFLCYQLGRYLPAATDVLKYVGAAYIVWLAIHVARSKPEDGDAGQITFWKGFLLQFVNVKTILYAVTVYTAYVLPHGLSLINLLLHSCCLTFVGTIGMLVWATAGGLLQKFLQKYYRPFNIIMALILLYSAVTLIV